MSVRSTARKLIGPLLDRSVALRGTLRGVDERLDVLRHAAAATLPQLIRPDPRRLFVALTADCNYRCKGCRYGRDFMPGHTLPLPVVRDLLEDAHEAGFEAVRLYGGEPLLHPDLPEIVRHVSRLGMNTWVTTNALLLRKKIDALFEAGLRTLSVGFYGLQDEYDRYVGRPGAFRVVEQGLAYTRERYGQRIAMHLDWLLMRPTCNRESIRATWNLARRFAMPIYVNLVHYSLPYFTGMENREIQFSPEDRPLVEEMTAELLRLQGERPDLFLNSPAGLRSIPDWLMKGPGMRVPCTAYRLIWVGADGTVQLCYVTFKLGNLHEKRLRDILFTREHGKAARDAFQLNCPNCHCGYDSRVLRHGPSRKLYDRELPVAEVDLAAEAPEAAFSPGSASTP
jgi:MoaA/NifB/PqqE/SkfB family radical SAM enzyme